MAINPPTTKQMRNCHQTCLHELKAQEKYNKIATSPYTTKNDHHKLKKDNIPLLFKAGLKAGKRIDEGLEAWQAERERRKEAGEWYAGKKIDKCLDGSFSFVWWLVGWWPWVAPQIHTL